MQRVKSTLIFCSAPDYSKYVDTEEPAGPQSHQSKSFKFLQDTLDRGQGRLRNTEKDIRHVSDEKDRKYVVGVY